MIVCNISDKAKDAIIVLTRNLLKKNPSDTPEDILKKLHSVVYQQLVKIKASNPELYSVGYIQYAAQKLSDVASSEKDEERETFRKLLGDSRSFDAVSIEKYTHENELRKLLGLKERLIVRAIPPKDEAFAESREGMLSKIKESFPDVTEKKIFSKGISPINNLPINPVELRVVRGSSSPMFSVSTFAKNAFPRIIVPKKDNGFLIPEGTAFQEPLAYGNMMDYSIRLAFRNRAKSFEDFKTILTNNKDLQNAFSAYTISKSLPENKPLDNELFKRYFDDYIHDVIYAVAKIEDLYKGSYITDLSELVNDNVISPAQKNSIILYNQSLGISGEVDFLAIHPDKTFTVLDIKTSKEAPDEQALAIFRKQTSGYTHILEQSTGLKSTGNADIISIVKDSRDFSKSLLATNPDIESRRKPIITDIQRYSQEVIPLNDFKNMVDAYRANVLNKYTEVPKAQAQTAATSSNYLSASTIAAKVLSGKKEPPLKQLISPIEPKSTPESLKQEAGWLVKAFPELEPGKSLVIVPELLSGSGGEFYPDLIILAEKSNQGVGYHEGWHRFSQLYLTPKEKESLYGEIRDLNTPFTTRDGREENTSSADFKDIEELLGDEFAKYAKDPEKYEKLEDNKPIKKSSLIRRIFQKI
jgi:hypothetical protein